MKAPKRKSWFNSHKPAKTEISFDQTIVPMPEPREIVVVQLPPLPNNQTCAQCAYCSKCEQLFGGDPTNNYCQFYPSRFNPIEP